MFSYFTRRKRSRAAVKGWETRRRNELSARARKGWETRRVRERTLRSIGA